MDDFSKIRGVFITSSGRTGTHFLGNVMNKMINNCFSVHEPDVLQIDKPRLWLRKIIQFGIIRIIFGRFSIKYSPRSLSNSRIKKEISEEIAISYLKKMRINEIKELKKDKIYLEANCQMIGLVDILPKLFSNSKIIYIIRDPRDWVRSWMNKPNTYYSMKDVRQWFGGRISAKSIKSDKYSKNWKKMDVFEKLCWAWNCENSYAFECSKTNNNIQVYRYEDLFINDMKEVSFKNMLNFATSFPDEYVENWHYNSKLFSKKYDSTNGNFVHWRKWNRLNSLILDKHCKSLMSKFNYGNEIEWKNKLE